MPVVVDRPSYPPPVVPWLWQVARGAMRALGWIIASLLLALWPVVLFAIGFALETGECVTEACRSTAQLLALGGSLAIAGVTVSGAVTASRRKIRRLLMPILLTGYALTYAVVFVIASIID